MAKRNYSDQKLNSMSVEQLGKLDRELSSKTMQKGGTTPKPTRQPEPEISLTELIKIRADERLKKEQRAWDHQHGRSGITDLLRPI